MVASPAPSIVRSERADYRSERDRAPGPYGPPTIGNGEYRNVYRRADGSSRIGPAWRDPEAASLAREAMPGETFVELRDTRWDMVSGSALAGSV
ncbi:hypothetical protein ACSD7O_22270 [Methylorubrum extorquens]|uniref:hypothetical protein n=1 Tax=Methylorubrum extorquens TaxID=408 RepID=UPI003F6351DC